MTQEVRALMAYVASRLISGAESWFVFDASGLGHRPMGGIVNEACVNVYDFSQNCQLSGHASGGQFHLFHHGERVHISLEIVAESFRGFDHGIGRPFSGAVNGPKVSIYDHSDYRRHEYWCESPQYSRLPSQESGGDELGLNSQAPESGPANSGGE